MDQQTSTGASLADDQRPRSFDDIIGQTGAVRVLQEELERRSGWSVLVHGPVGCGKTTIAEVYAKGILCENAGVRPCPKLACRSCKLFEVGRTPRLNFVDIGGHPNYRRVICRDKDDKGVIVALDQDVFVQSLSGGRKVFLIDDLHNLSSQGFDDLHHRLERLPSHVTFVMCTSDLSTIPMRVQTLCPNLSVAPLTVPDRVRLLTGTCDAQEIPYEDEAITLIAELAATDTRSPIRDLQLLLTGECISPKTVMQFYKVNAISPLETYIQSVLDRSGIDHQIEVMKDWTAEPHVKIKCVETYLAFLMSHYVARVRPSSLPRLIRSARAEARIVEDIAGRIAASSLSEIQYWATLAEHWRATAATTESSLRVMILSFDDLVNGHNHNNRAKREQDNGRVGPRRPRTGRSIAIPKKPGVLPRAGEGHLPLPKVLAMWESASFMAQVHGVLFNTYLKFNHTKLGTQESIASIISDFTHELRPLLRPMNSSGKRTQLRVPMHTPSDLFHWIYLHEHSSNDELITYVVAHIPISNGDVQGWIGKFFERRIGVMPQDDSFIVRRAPQSKRKELDFHYRLLRRLCRAVNPGLHVWLDNDGIRSRYSWAELLGLDSRICGSVTSVPGLKPCGWAQTIGLGARKKAKKERFAAISIADRMIREAWSRENQGWELVEHRNRTLELAERQKNEQDLMAKWPPGPQREVALTGLRSKWPKDPLMRQRSEAGWWTGLKS